MTNQKVIHLKGLNEIRGIAALGVVFGHLGYGDPNMAPNMVTIFFVLSGFLISYLLLKEKQKINDIDIKKFYVRRTLRIWPLYFSYVILALLISNQTENLLSYILFGGNFALAFHITYPLLGHYWSLGVEEQFYLFWPWLTKYIKDFKNAMIGVIAIYVIIKLSAYLFYGGDSDIYRFVYLTKFQSMAIGGLGAYFLFYSSPYLTFVHSKAIQVISWGYIILTMIGKAHIASIVDTELLSIFTILVILQQVSLKKQLIPLNNKSLNFIGKISFGIYVLHMLIIHYIEKTLAHYNLENEFITLTLVVVITIIVSYLSYTYLEKPFLKLKSRYMVVKSSSELPK